MIRYIVRLSNSWLVQHKSRYILSVVALILSCITMLLILSIGSNIQNSMHASLDENSLYRQIRIVCKDQVIDENIAVRIAEDSGAVSYRISMFHNLELESIGKIPFLLSSNRICVISSKGSMILNSDFEEMNYLNRSATALFEGRMLDANSDFSAVVTLDFLQLAGLPENKAIGSVLIFKDPKGETYEYKISGIIYPTMSWADSNTLIYLPYSKAVDISLPVTGVNTITLDVANISQVSTTNQRLITNGFTTYANLDAVNYFVSTSRNIKLLGYIIGLSLFVLSSFALLNSILLTINENMHFFGIMYAVGVQNSAIRIQIAYLSAVLGAVGSIIGILLSIGIRPLYLFVADCINPNITDMIAGSYLNLKDCAIVFLYCVMVSILISMVPAKFIRNQSPVTLMNRE